MREINAATVGEPSIRSAFDMVLYDILGQAACVAIKINSNQGWTGSKF
jgi:hypothetical protein